MSKENDKEKFLVVTPIRKVTIEADDATNILEFFTEFKLAIPEYLSEATTCFVKEQNNQTQNNFRVALCRAFKEGTEPMLFDDIFMLIKENARQIIDYDEFENQLSDILTQE